APVSIDIPSTLPEDTTLNPHATLTNNGTNTVTFSVICTIDPGAYISTTVSNIAPGDSIQVTFPDEFTFESGYYTVTVYTNLDIDEIPTNDTLEKVIETHDPGVTEWGSDIPDVFTFTTPTITKNRTEIMFALPEATKVDLVVYDALGRLAKILVSERLSAGIHTISTKFDLPASVYF
ncbi:unnamed protein product, partial [marine sediment metagenome]